MGLLLLASLLLAAEATRLGKPIVIVESESIENESRSRRLQDKNIVEVAIDAAPEFTTLVDIVGLLDLGDALSGDGPLTVRKTQDIHWKHLPASSFSQFTYLIIPLYIGIRSDKSSL